MRNLKGSETPKASEKPRHYLKVTNLPTEIS
jgi:hypothetical protein